MASPIKFSQSYNGYDPATIFQADPTTKTLTPYDSGDAYTAAGYQFGQEQVADPKNYAGYSIAAPITKASQLAAVGADLNSYQDSLFSGADTTTDEQRQSSQLGDEISQAESDQAAAEKQFEDQRAQYNALDNPNYEADFNQLRTDQGVPQTEQDLLDTQAAERNLPTDLKTASGNAGVETNSLYEADLAQKQQPLLLKEQTLNDRLNLANNYIQTALSLKETDSDAARSNLEKAIALTQDSISAFTNRISTLSGLKSDIQSQINQGANTAEATINTLVQSGSLQNLPAAELRTLEAEAGMPAGTLSAIQQSVKPTDEVVTTQTDDNGNVSIVTRDSQTGIFTTHTIPGIGNKQNSGSSTLTYNEAKSAASDAAASTIGSVLASKAGKTDGYVSPETFKQALAAWTSDGYSTDDFVTRFRNYINPADVQDYGAFK